MHEQKNTGRKQKINTQTRLILLVPSSGELAALTASLSLSRRVMRCFSSSLCFSAFASSQRPSSINRWSGRLRLSVGATPSSGSLSVKASEEKKYMFSAPSLWKVMMIKNQKHEAKTISQMSILPTSLQQELTVEGSLSRFLWLWGFDRQSSVCLLCRSRLYCSAWSWRTPSSHPRFLIARNEPSHPYL